VWVRRSFRSDMLTMSEHGAPSGALYLQGTQSINMLLLRSKRQVKQVCYAAEKVPLECRDRLPQAKAWGELEVEF